jgi:hercynine metabolism protein
VSNPADPNDSGSWFEQLQAKLDQQLEAFLRANPAQEALLQDQEQQERSQQLRQRRSELNQQADVLRAELLQQAATIQQWQARVQRARQAGASDLASRAEAHVEALMEQGRQRWQLLEVLGEAYAELEQTLQREQGRQHTAPTSSAGDHGSDARSEATPTPDLEQAWARFETEQELEQLRRRQRS